MPTLSKWLSLPIERVKLCVVVLEHRACETVSLTIPDIHCPVKEFALVFSLIEFGHPHLVAELSWLV